VNTIPIFRVLTQQMAPFLNYEVLLSVLRKSFERPLSYFPRCQFPFALKSDLRFSLG
jgi:hypothetical protein